MEACLESDDQRENEHRAEVPLFFGIMPQAVCQRIFKGRLETSKVRAKRVAREHRISAEAICDH